MIDVNEYASNYLVLRRERELLKREYENSDNKIKEKMAVLEAALLEECKAANVKSMRVDAGTVMHQVRRRYWPSDWGAMYNFIHEHRAYELLERRVHQANLSEFLETNPGTVPPGLNVDTEDKIVVRAA